MALKTLTRQVERPRLTVVGDTRSSLAEMVAAVDFSSASDRDRKWLGANIIRTQNTARKAWDNYEKIGEVHKAISRAARIAGYARLRCVEVNPDGTDGPTVETGAAADIVKGIYAPYGGTRGLIDRYFSCMKIPGDTVLVEVTDDEGSDGYHFMSADEVKRDSLENYVAGGDSIEWITLPYQYGGRSEPFTRTVRADDILGRVWLPGRRWVDIPDSPLDALSTECEVLYQLTQTLLANIYNRWILGGIMALPIETQNVKVVGLAQGNNQDILDYLEAAMSRAVADPSDPKVRLPILALMKGEAIEQIKHITLDREIFEQDLILRRDLIERILFGLDIQTQATKGNEDANHFTAWIQSDEEVRIAIQPDLDTMCWALTRLVLHRKLKDQDADPAEIMGLRVAWDMSESAVRTNKQEDIRQAWDRGLSSDEALMRSHGLNVNDDEPSEQEKIRWWGLKHDNSYFALFEGGYAEIDWEEAKLWDKNFKPGPTAGAGEDPNAGPGVGEPGSPGDGERTGRRPAPS